MPWAAIRAALWAQRSLQSTRSTYPQPICGPRRLQRHLSPTCPKPNSSSTPHHSPPCFLFSPSTSSWVEYLCKNIKPFPLLVPVCSFFLVHSLSLFLLHLILSQSSFRLLTQISISLGNLSQLPKSEVGNCPVHYHSAVHYCISVTNSHCLLTCNTTKLGVLEGQDDICWISGT